ncbi:MAG: disulfide bond formation protein DsbB [Gammaproteobacteria bacterium]|nr:disulfide bond formation protein DsbB [Gammaproteobacteria bacterium]
MFPVVARSSWWLLAFSALALEVAALWFQHGMGLDPCVKCVYERVAVLGIFAAGIIGSVYPRALLFRVLGYLLWLISAGWGLRLALQHVGIQQDPATAFGCSFSAEFPAWAPLDSWLPQVFLPTGYCDDVQWQWLSLTMAQWMLVVFGIYLLLLAVVVYSDWRQTRRG